MSIFVSQQTVYTSFEVRLGFVHGTYASQLSVLQLLGHCDLDLVQRVIDMEIAIEVITISRQMFIIVIRVDLDQPRLEMLLVDSIHVRNTLEEVMLDVKHPAQLPVFNRLVKQNFNRFRG